MKHIVLIGFMGCGKTRIGRELAHKLKLPFVDVDKEIVEKEGMPIADIFDDKGEAFFRELETEMFKTLVAKKEQSVISAGGGLPIQENNQKYLENCEVVYLTATVDVLAKRLSGDKKRPILKGGNLREKITTLKAKRDPIYERVSDITVDTSDVAVDKIVAQIIDALDSRR